MIWVIILNGSLEIHAIVGFHLDFQTGDPPPKNPIQRTDEIPSGLWPCAVGSPQVWEDSQNKLNKHRTNTEQKLTGAKRRVAGWVAGVAGMMKLLVMTGIIPENSLLSFQSPKKRTPNRRTCASAVTETFGGSENHG